MRAIRTWGSVRGVPSNRHPYRDQRRDGLPRLDVRGPLAREGWNGFAIDTTPGWRRLELRAIDRNPAPARGLPGRAGAKADGPPFFIARTPSPDSLHCLSP